MGDDQNFEWVKTLGKKENIKKNGGGRKRGGVTMGFTEYVLSVIYLRTIQRNCLSREYHTYNVSRRENGVTFSFSWKENFCTETEIRYT